jgi:hypothetical protein
MAVEAPPPDRGLLVIHGYRGIQEGEREIVRVGHEIGPTNVCSMAWLPAGRHVASWTSLITTFETAVSVSPRAAAHVHPPRSRRSDGEVKRPPWYHRCRLRSLEYVEGVVPSAVLARVDPPPSVL